MRISDWSSDVCSSDLIIEKGFAATSIEELVEAAGITKSGFFYHFKDKNDLARQLLERYLAESEIVLDQLEARARELHDDPLHAFLLFLKLYSEMFRDMIAQHPGCIVRSAEHTSELPSLMRSSYAVFCLKTKKKLN